MISFVAVVPDKTVYVTDNGSYFASYNSLTQARKPVLLMYCKKGMFISSLSKYTDGGRRIFSLASRKKTIEQFR